MSSRFHRFGHSQHTPIVKIGDLVVVGQKLGEIGHTGNAEGSHLHYDILKTRPSNPYEYVAGMSKLDVLLRYTDPSTFIKNNLPAPNTLNTGYSFLQWTGNLYHSGIDINSPGDEGKDYFSPVNGEVIFVSPADNYDHGWGNMLIIEETIMPNIDSNFGKRLAGKFLLDVDNHGRLWYVDMTGLRHDVGITPEDCSAFLHKIASQKIPLGITGDDLAKIPLAP